MGAIIFTAFGMPWAVFGFIGCGGDITNAAIVAGFFSVLNTWLNLRMLRQVDEVKTQVGVVKTTAREGHAALTDLADIKRNGEDE